MAGRAAHHDPFETHGLCAARGFLPQQDPRAALPPDFDPLRERAEALPRWLLSGRVREVLEALPPLPVETLEDDADLRCAMRQLSFLGHAYVWGGEPAAGRIPACLARPWAHVAARLGRPPVLSYASYALDNWRRLDRDGPVELGNVALLQNFLSGADEDWFIGVHIDIEYKAAPVLRHVLRLQRAVECDDADAVAAGLAVVDTGIERLVAALRRMPEFCDPYIYYRRVRPFIHGWSDQPALPRGVVYEGVDAFGGVPQRFRGETGAQSGIVPVLDALLGVEHGDDPLRKYLGEMRGYMPPAHRAFVEAVEHGPSLRRWLQGPGRDAELLERYNACLDHLAEFRRTHLDYAIAYIQRQSQTSAANPTEVGTGGTPFVRYLRKHWDETATPHL